MPPEKHAEESLNPDYERVQLNLSRTMETSDLLLFVHGAILHNLITALNWITICYASEWPHRHDQR